MKDNTPEHYTHMLLCRMVLNSVIVPPAPINPDEFEPCGGCGNADPDQRCLGCMHPFTRITAHLGAEHV